MEKRSKAETFIGFSIKARKARFGVNAIGTLKKVNLLLLCQTASENTKNDAVKLAKRFRCKLLITAKKTVEELSGKENCKLMAITDKDLAKAISENINDEFTESKWEEDR